ncbi:unnamed protein product, partial [marine sediment metagenome]
MEKKVNELNDPGRLARQEDIRKKLQALVNEYGVSYFCVILTPTIIEEVDEGTWIREEDVFLAGHGPKKHLLDTLIKRMRDIDDGTDIPWTEFLKDIDDENG